MCYDNYLKFNYPAIFLIVLIFTSCGSYQYVGTDNDGIYDSTYDNVEYVEATQETTNSNDYYQNYFKEKRLEYDAMAEESEIFTDVDSYSSDNYTEQDSIDNTYRGYSGWGQANENVTINIYDNGWNNWGWNTWGWNAGFGWGWNSWRWNRWYQPWGWNVGFGWGWNNWGWYDPFWCPPYYNYFQFNPYGYGLYYNGRNVRYGGYAYNYGRRGYYSNVGRSSLSRRSNLVNSTRNYNTPRRNSSIRSYTPRRNSTLSNSRTRNTVRPRSSSSLSTPRTSTRPRRNNSSVSQPRSRSNSSSSFSSPSRSSSSGSRSSSSRSSGGRRR